MTAGAAAPRQFTTGRGPIALPPDRVVDLEDLAATVRWSRRVVVLDDDPTGTQTVAGVPVLTEWTVEDIRWAIRQNTTGFFILTNTRSLSADAASARNGQVASAAFAAADAESVDIVFASRSDSTLRGHFPLETDVLAEVSASLDEPVDAIIVVPAYLDAGRVTVDSTHWLLEDGTATPVGSSEFARDATFGYTSSRLPEWIEEKSGGRIGRDAVELVTLKDLRADGPEAVARRLRRLHDGRMVVADALTEDDLRLLALAVIDAEADGSRFLYRSGPSFVRARLGQPRQAPLDRGELGRLVAAGAGAGGLIVVGSHVGRTTRQLARLRERVPVIDVDLDVPRLLDADGAGAGAAADLLAEVASAATRSLRKGTVVLSTTRTLIRGSDADDSLRIARAVSSALTGIVGSVVRQVRPSFVLAKGGITSSDVATESLGITRAWVRGSLLEGTVSLWEPAGGPATGIPYIVFAGNVGDDDALADAVERLVHA